MIVEKTIVPKNIKENSITLYTWRKCS